MSNATRTAVRVVKESTFKTTPAAPVFEQLRVTSQSMGAGVQTVVSNELVDDRQILDLIQVGYESGGDIPIEMSFRNADRIIEGAMMALWVPAPIRNNNGTADSQITDVNETTGTTVFTVAAAVAGSEVKEGAFAAGHLVRNTGFTNAGNNGLLRLSAGSGTSATATLAGVDEASPAAAARMKVVGVRAAANGEIAATTSGGNQITSSGDINFISCGFVAGMWFKASGFAVAALNGWYRALTVAAGAIVCDVVPVSFATNAAATEIVSLWFGDYIRNGTTKMGYTIEVEHKDLTAPEFHYYPGSRFNSFGVNADTKAILTGSANLMGAGEPTAVTTRFASATTKTAPTNAVMNTSRHVGAIFEAGVAMAAPNACLHCDLNIGNSLRRQDAIGDMGSQDIELGDVVVDGTLRFYYGNKNILDKVRANTESSFMFRTTDPAGTAATIYDLPRLKFTEGDPQTTGKNTDRTIEPGFQGLKHATFGYTLHIQNIEEFA